MWIAVWKRWCESREHAEYEGGCQTTCGSGKSGPGAPWVADRPDRTRKRGFDIAWGDYAFVAASDGYVPRLTHRMTTHESRDSTVAREQAWSSCSRLMLKETGSAASREIF